MSARRPRAILKNHSNSYPFEERTLDLTNLVKVGRAVAKFKPQCDNAIFDCKVLSRNHAVIWFENGRFFLKDTCSSNGTFINNNRLSPATEESPGKEIHSNDIIQFGVEVVDSTSKITHGCIILKIKLFYPNGSEASKTSTLFNIPNMLNIPTANMLPPYYSYNQMLERERDIYEKLSSIEDALEGAHLLADITLDAKKQERELVKRLDELQNVCDEKTNLAQRLDMDLEKLNDRVMSQESRHVNDSNQIRSLEKKLREKEMEIENLRNQLDRLIKQDHRLVTTQFLLLLIVLVVGGFDMIVMFLRLIW